MNKLTTIFVAAAELTDTAASLQDKALAYLTALPANARQNAITNSFIELFTLREPAAASQCTINGPKQAGRHYSVAMNEGADRETVNAAINRVSVAMVGVLRKAKEAKLTGITGFRASKGKSEKKFDAAATVKRLAANHDKRELRAIAKALAEYVA